MKRLCVLAALALLLIFGCTSSNQDSVYYVMFEGTPNIFDTGIYFQGSRIGEIVSQETGNGLAHKAAIRIDPEHQEIMQNRTIFYVSSGRLNYATFGAFGDPLPLGSPVLGFRSKAAMYGFRLTHLTQPLPSAAAEQADWLLKRVE